MINKIIMATNNKHKLAEVQNILSPLGIKVISQSEAGANVEPEENGTTFEENSKIKASAVYDITKLPVIADDSGICVDYLDGAPGVYSARFAPAGQECNALLKKLEGVESEKRSASFVCVITFIDENGNATAIRGECFGKIGFEKRGENGFGYDPVFMYGDRSFAEISSEEKNQISHRALALKKLYDMFNGRNCD